MPKVSINFSGMHSFIYLFSSTGRISALHVYFRTKRFYATILQYQSMRIWRGAASQATR